MTTDTKQVNFANKVRIHGVAAQAGHFLRHLLEMVMAMSIGMAVGGALALWAARMIGYSDPLHQIPEVSALVMAFNTAMLIPMVFRLDLYAGRTGHMAHAHH